MNSNRFKWPCNCFLSTNGLTWWEGVAVKAQLSDSFAFGPYMTLCELFRCKAGFWWLYLDNRTSRWHAQCFWTSIINSGRWVSSNYASWRSWNGCCVNITSSERRMSLLLYRPERGDAFFSIYKIYLNNLYYIKFIYNYTIYHLNNKITANLYYIYYMKVIHCQCYYNVVNVVLLIHFIT